MRRRRRRRRREPTSPLVTRLRFRKNSSFFRPMVRRSTTSSISTVSRPSELSNTTSTKAAMTFAPAPSWSRCCRCSCRSVLKFPVANTNWMASKKLDFPDPFRPTITLCLELGEGSGRAGGGGVYESDAVVVEGEGVDGGREGESRRSAVGVGQEEAKRGERRCGSGEGKEAHLNGSISDCCRNDRKPLMITCFICMAPWSRLLSIPGSSS